MIFTGKSGKTAYTFRYIFRVYLPSNAVSTRTNPKLLDKVRQIMRIKHYSIHTERSYCEWVRQYVKFHQLTNKLELLVNSETKIEAFLTYLAMERNVAASTQNQAMNVLAFLYKQEVKKAGSTRKRVS